MRNIWFTSDTHWFHANMLRFKDDNGNFVRPFPDLYSMHETMIEKHNSLVKDEDLVWHLGDVTFRYDGAFNALWHRLKGKFRLVPGNHDKLKNPNLFPKFEKVEYWRGFKEHNFTCTHVPFRLDCLRDGQFNVHGHVHQRTRPEKQYINVCVEVRDYKPVHLDTIIQEIKERS